MIKGELWRGIFEGGKAMKKFKISETFLASLICVVMLIMSLALLPISPILSAIHFAITLAISVLEALILKYRKYHTLDISENVKKFFGANSGDILEAVPMPVIIVSASNINEILFYNDNFKTAFLDKGYCSGSGLEDILPRETTETLLSKVQTVVKIGSENYKVYIRKFYDFVILYFKDDTLYKELKQKYIDSRVCVGYFSFDNKEELRQSLSDEKLLHMSLLVEDTIQKWLVSVGGVFEKINDGKYLAVFEEKYLKRFIGEKFSILEKIHNLKSEGKYATISAGISRGADTFEESRVQAKSALNMALGRGGDQIAVKNKSSYEFFGGKSGGLEKRSKVRTRVVARAIMEKMESADIVLLMGHKFSDFDSVGAAAALWSVCARAKRKPCYIVINKNQTLSSELIKYLESFENKMFVSPEHARGIATENTLLVVLDTHTEKFVEDSELYSKCKNIVVVDHHRMSVDKITNASIFFHEPFASSTCEMVTEMVQYMDDKKLKKPEADALLAGITLDTKNFSLKTGIRTFEAAAYLKKKGADSLTVKQFFSNSLDAYKLRCKVIEEAAIIENCAVVCLADQDENLRLACSQAADELLNIKGVKASFVIFKNNGIINISARSLGGVNVQVVMEKFGGGGHQTMAAAQIKDSKNIDEIKENLVEILHQESSNQNKNGE